MKYLETCKTYRSYLKAGSEMAALLEKHLDKNNFLPLDLIAELSIVHAAHYHKDGFCEVILTKEGGYRFKDAEGKEHKTAQMQWSRKIDPHHNRVRSKRGGAHESLRKDPVGELLNSIKTLSAKQRTDLLIKAFYDLPAKQRADFVDRIK